MSQTNKQKAKARTIWINPDRYGFYAYAEFCLRKRRQKNRAISARREPGSKYG